MKTQTADEIIARIAAAAREAPGGVVATDGDGTLWSGDVGEDLFHAFLERGEVRPLARDAMIREAARHGVDPGGDAVTLARRIYEEYLAGRFPEEPVCELMTWCFAEWTRAEVHAFARVVIAEATLEARLHPELQRVLDWVRAAGIDVYLVSASPTCVVEAAGELLGFDRSRVVAASPLFERASETMLADVSRPIPYGGGKVSGLRARIGERPLYAAFGDNAFDLMMLHAALIPVGVRPKPKLRARAAELPALVELARAT